VEEKTLEERVEILELLPPRVDALEVQISQFRAEVRDDFSATRSEVRAMGDELGAEMRSLNEETRAEMRMLHEDVVERIGLLGEGRTRTRTHGRRKKR
jgi:hypothetical protein